MGTMKKLAVAVLAVAGLSGCATTRVDDLAQAEAAQTPANNVPATELKVSRAMASYGSRGGYRFRRFAAVAVPS